MRHSEKKQSFVNSNDVIKPRTSIKFIELYQHQEKIISVFHTWSPKTIKKALENFQFWKEVLFSLKETDNLEYRQELQEIGFILNDLNKALKDVTTDSIIENLELISDAKRIAQSFIKGSKKTKKGKEAKNA